MKNSLYILGLSLISISAAHAVSFKGTCDTLNGVIGKVGHQVAKVVKPEFSDERLKPENEEAVRDIIKKMGVTKHIEIYKLPDGTNNAYALGNNIYLDESELFEDFEDNPEVRQFTVGHELVHADNNHSLKKLAVVFVLSYGVSKAFNKGLQWVGIDKKSLEFDMQDPFTLENGARLYGGTLIGVCLGYGVLKPLFMPYVRMHEREADLDAQERLGPIYGKDTLAQGAALTLAHNPEPHTLLQRINTTHPHWTERLRYLKISKDYIDNHLERLVTDLKHHCFNELLDLAEGRSPLEEPFHDSFRSHMPISKLMCSVYPETAQTALERLQSDEFALYLDSLLDRLKVDFGKGGHSESSVKKRLEKTSNKVWKYLVMGMDDLEIELIQESMEKNNHSLTWLDEARVSVEKRLKLTITKLCEFLEQYA